MLDTARQFLSNLPSMSGDTERAKRPEVRVGFVGPIMRKLKSPLFYEGPQLTGRRPTMPSCPFTCTRNARSHRQESTGCGHVETERSVRTTELVEYRGSTCRDQASPLYPIYEQC